MSSNPGGRDPAGDAEERDAFEAAVADVQPLAHDQHPPAARTPEPVALSERDRQVIRELDQLVAGETPFDVQHSDEFIEATVPGLDPRVLRRLRSGEYVRQAHLDLHGVDAKSAREQVERFVCESQALGLRCLRIVHGRGLNSPDGVPVIKSSLPRWLARGPARHLVLAYTSALANDGGTGASYVLLRRQRKT